MFWDTTFQQRYVVLLHVAVSCIYGCENNSPQTSLMYNMTHAGMNPKYVEDPQAFKPERWDRERETRLDPFLSVPFGVGPRSCYGRFMIILLHMDIMHI